MRPIFFFTLLIFVLQSQLEAQDPVSAALRIREWPLAEREPEGIGWTAFSRQYYCISNWNASGLSVRYASGAGHSAAVVFRDGIPGFSWYHLYLSHFRQFSKFGGILQFRFSMIDLKDHPPVFRLGGNIRTIWTISETMKLQVSIYDFPGWILPGTTLVRGDPAMEFMLFGDPGRLMGMAAGFRISGAHFGPVTAGVRMKVNDRVGLTTMLDVLPFGVALGISYQLKGYRVKGWMDQRHGLGVTPLVEIVTRR